MPPAAAAPFESGLRSADRPAPAGASGHSGVPARPSGLPPVPLAQLAVPEIELHGSATTCVTGVTLDSRAVRAGDLYAALPGSRVHGAVFAREAVTAGAAAVLTDPTGAARVPAGVPLLVHPRPREVLGHVAATVYAAPSTDICLLGVTGTNGKTTTAYLLEAGLRAGGYVTGLVGTVETHVAGAVASSVRTTPEAPDLQALLAVMRERGVTAAAMEVSSHALALGRVDGTRYAVSLFTNLSQDHLDFHRTFADYEAAKAALFTPERSARAVINRDDPAGRRIAARTGVPLTTFSASGDPTADWRATEVTTTARGGRARLLGPGGVDLVVRVALPGAFNVANAIAAVATLVEAGVAPEVAARGIADLTGVPGRMERIEAGQEFVALVDYAHTPMAVASLLAELRPLTRGRLGVVLGCGGDRDRAKRPLMAAAAVTGADYAVFTSDNPRSEDPLAILAAMEAGARAVARASYAVEPDRAAAIQAAVDQARAGDVLVVAGKGHEQGQEFADGVVAFDDRVVLRDAIVRRAKA